MTDKPATTDDPSSNFDAKPDAHAYGRALRGWGVNILVSDVTACCRFTAEVLGIQTRYQDREFAILRHGNADWMLHSDSTYDNHPLLSLTAGDGIRGGGIELRVYGVDPDAAVDRAVAAGYEIFQAPTDKPHGLREAYIVGPDYYIWVPSRALADS
jgi:hypothetical protein